ncbi:MAG: DNA-binding protein [Thermoplasmatales archaeon]|nr:MAG: DNA-binding protein [Thermoplasmatales archaeon]
MHYKRFGDKVIVRIDRGEEIVKTLKQLCKDLDIKLGTITGIGATDRATIGLYDVGAKEYHSTELIGDHEIAPVYGNISKLGDEVYLHLHANLCNAEHKSFGGHLNSATVSATFEAFIEIMDGEINRIFDKKIGLNLLDI